jgi:glycosyltransferase involved in cell wall biosynthesis
LKTLTTISVIVPIYNAEKYLAKCIESLIQQSHTALQIILVNDGSTDQCLAIAKEYAKTDTRIEVYSHPTNQGQSAARNLGLQHATGEFISFVDADDYVDNDFYAYMLHHIGNLDCVQIGYRRVTKQGKVLIQKLPRHFHQFTSPCMRLYRHEFFAKHNLSFPMGMIYEDVIFSLDFWAAKPTYKMLPYTGYNYLANTNSTTATRNLVAKELLFATLNEKRQKSTSFFHRLLILYTTIRLLFHFKRYD